MDVDFQFLLFNCLLKVICSILFEAGYLMDGWWKNTVLLHHIEHIGHIDAHSYLSYCELCALCGKNYIFFLNRIATAIKIRQDPNQNHKIKS